MGTLERHANGMDDGWDAGRPDWWDAGRPDWWDAGRPEVAPDGTGTTADVRKASQQDAEDAVGQAIHTTGASLGVLSQHQARMVQGMTDDLRAADLAEYVAWLQDARRTLAELEGLATRELGLMELREDTLTLSDGRQAEVLRGKDRKEWRHDDWQRDARTAIIQASGLTDPLAVNPETGETVNVADLMAQAEAVHGAGAPKVTALKALGLSADDYCSSTTGPFAVKVSARPTPTQEG